MKVTLLICFLALFAAAPSISVFPQQPGDLDPTFGDGGKLTDGLTRAGDAAQSVALQSDGKIVVAGYDPYGGDRKIKVARYDPDGSLDPSFGGDGRVIISRGTAMAVVIQSDGKIVIAGSAGSGFGLVRLNTDGSLDTSFGSGGRVTSYSGNGIAYCIAIQPDGKIIAAGSHSGSAQLLIRHNADGSLDNSFGTGGIIQTLNGGPIYSVSIQLDGKVLAAGGTGTDGGSKIVRYDTNGALDPGFGTSGVFMFGLPPTVRSGERCDLAIQTDGKIVAGCGGWGQFALARVNSNGSALDPTFGGGVGYVLRAGYVDDIEIAVQPEGKILVGGGGFVSRFHPSGGTDITFDDDGTVEVGGGPFDTGLALQPDGKVVFASLTNDDFLVGRLAVNGSMDNTFGGDGAVTTDFGLWGIGDLRDVKIQSDGKIVAIGDGLARYNSDGSPDTSFGSAGKVDARGESAAIQPDGKIVVVCGFCGITVTRFNFDGSLDASFSGDGIATTPIADYQTYAFSVAIQPDGKIIAAGSGEYINASDFGTSDAFIVRYNPDGSPDTTFDIDGVLHGQTDGITSVAIQADQKIVTTSRSFTLARYNIDGSLDTSFGIGGTASAQLGYYSIALSVIIQPDGRIVAAGSSAISNSNPLVYDFALVRYNSNGTLDTSFDGDGKVLTPMGSGWSFARDVAFQPDGKIVAAGDTGPANWSSPRDFALARYNPNGSLDTTFGGGDGISIVDFDDSDDWASGMALDRHGRAVVVGESDLSFALARVLLGTSGPTPTPTPTPTPIPSPSPHPTTTPTPGPPATIMVTNTNDSGVGSLRQAIADAVSGDTINFNVTGMITLTSGQLVIDKNLTIQGPGASLLSISGNNVSRVFDISSGITAALYGMTVRDGHSLDCGGIAHFGGTLTVSNTVIYGNVAIFSGGGICNYGGTLTINNSTISNNYGPGEFEGAPDAGGIFAETGTVIVINSTISGNTGGGIHTGYSIGANPTINITNSTISGNTATWSGGGIDCGRGVVSVNNSIISGNTARIAGGGISTGGDGSTMTITNSTISGNVVLDDGGTFNNGGGIANYGSMLTITNSTISGNTDYGIGGAGGIWNYDNSQYNSIERLENTIVAGNIGTVKDIYGPIESASHNLIGDAASSGGITNGVNGNIVGVNPLLGPLRNNGGPTMTHALLPGSPAINAGNNCVLTANGCGNGNPALPTDQRGMPRNGTVDIGAFELSAAPRVTAFDYDGDGRADLSVRRPVNNVWYLLRTTAGYTAMQYGVAGDRIIPADYDGDGKTDVAVFRPSNGTWHIFNSGSQSFQEFTWGVAGDIPVPADHDGDGKADLVIFRPSTGTWYTRFSNNSFSSVTFGVAGDKPVVGDFDGDGRYDVAVWRPSDGNWYILKTNFGFFAQTWGVPGDIPVPADYDGDGKTDVAVWRPSTGQWYRIKSREGFDELTWGVAGDTPVPADYDGDGKVDVAVFRPSNATWYIVGSYSGQLFQQYGQTGDLPTQGAFIY